MGISKATFLAIATLFAAQHPLHAEEAKKPIELSAEYTADVIGVVGRDVGDKLYWLDNLNLTADADLERLVHWPKATLHVHVLNNLGGEPNGTAATLQGVDNIEVASQRVRLFEAWIEQGIGKHTSIRAGLYDLNSEFYSNEAAHGLIAPAFGVGSEISATGPNGPSIFPSTALAVRVDHHIGGSGIMRFAALNANARTLGDPKGVDFNFSDGALLIGEAGIEGDMKAVFGLWAYTKRQDDLRAVDPQGNPVKRAAHGAYVILEHPIDHREGPGAASLFFRGGISDGRTTPFRGGWQAGLMLKQPFADRPEGVLTIGANQGYLSGGFRAQLRDDGLRAVAAETAIEMTYADKILGRLRVQPDVQFIINPGGERDRGVAMVFGMRFGIGF